MTECMFYSFHTQVFLFSKMAHNNPFEQFSASAAEIVPTLPRQQQQIAQYVLQSPDDVALGTVATVAEAAGVQPSALIRFANNMGFAGFTEMQQVFRARLLDRAGSYRERIESMRRSGTGSVSQAGVLHQFVSNGMADLGALEDNVRSEQLIAAARLLVRADRVHVLAQRRAFPVACYLAYALTQLDVRAQLLDGVGGMLQDNLRHLRAGDVLVTASFKNYSPEVVAAAAAARGRGVGVIAITDFSLSPLKPHADVCFELGQGPDPTFRSLVAPLCLAQALVVTTGHQMAQPTSPRARTRATSERPVARTRKGR